MSGYKGRFKRLSERNENGFTGEYVSIGQLLNAYLSKHEYKSNKARIEMHWQKTFGDYISNHTSNIFFRNGLLTITVDSSSLRNELMMNKTHIIKLLNESLGEALVLNIEFY